MRPQTPGIKQKGSLQDFAGWEDRGAIHKSRFGEVGVLYLRGKLSMEPGGPSTHIMSSFIPAILMFLL